MFGFRRRALEFLDNIDLNVVETIIKLKTVERQLIRVMSNQELLDGYAARIAEQNNQIKAAIAVIVSEIGKLQRAAEVPLDTTKMDAAIAQLTTAVDEVEAIPAPAVEDEPAADEPVDVVENENNLELPPWQTAE